MGKLRIERAWKHNLFSNLCEKSGSEAKVCRIPATILPELHKQGHIAIIGILFCNIVSKFARVLYGNIAHHSTPE